MKEHDTEDRVFAPVENGLACMLRVYPAVSDTDHPEWATLVLTQARARELLRLCRIVDDLDVHQISAFDYSPDYWEWKEGWDEDDDPADEHWDGEGSLSVRTDMDQVHCYRDGVRWSAVYKYTDLKFSTGEIPMKVLEAIAEVKNGR